MLIKIREILLTQYIGAILIAVLGGNALIALFTSLLRSAFWLVTQSRTHSAYGAPEVSFRWDDLVFSLISNFLYLLVAYALARWLYPETTDLPVEATDSDSEQPAIGPENS